MSGNAVIGIGGPKCGTTTLANLLMQDDRLFWPKNFSNKEINYFTKRYGNSERGLDWYFSHFPNKEANDYLCEISPSYFSDPNSPELIKRQLPDAKLVAILRDPVKRAFSSFQHEKRACRIPSSASFEDMIMQPDNKYYLDSCYHQHLKRYFDMFDRTQIHVIFLEELLQNNLQELTKLYKFLGLSHTNLDNVRMEQSNEAWQPKSYSMEYLLRNGSRLTKKLGLRRVMERVRKAGLDSFIRNVNSRPSEKLDVNIYDRIFPEFDLMNKELKQLLGRQDLPWQNSRKTTDLKARS